MGGWNGGVLNTCEKYSVDRNKWEALAPLITPRMWSGSILLKSRRAMCFCGTQGNVEVNSIEKIELETESEWKALPRNEEIAQTGQLAAVSFHNKIALFGGIDHASFNMYILSEDGGLEQDLSSDPLIPGGMNQGTYLVKKGQIYAVGWRKLGNEEKWRAKAFNGKFWNIIDPSKPTRPCWLSLHEPDE